MFRFALCSLVLLSACATPSDPCAYGCISTFVEWEEGYGPLTGQ